MIARPSTNLDCRPTPESSCRTPLTSGNNLSIDSTFATSKRPQWSSWALQPKSESQEPLYEYIKDLQGAQIRDVLCNFSVGWPRAFTMPEVKIQVFLVAPELRAGGGRKAHT